MIENRNISSDGYRGYARSDGASRMSEHARTDGVSRMSEHARTDGVSRMGEHARTDGSSYMNGHIRTNGQDHMYEQTNMYRQYRNEQPSHVHRHEITKCLHETTEGMPKGSMASGAGGMKAAGMQPQPRKESFSLRDFFADRFRGLISRASGFWARLGEEDGRDTASAESKSSAGEGKGIPPAIEGNKGENGVFVGTEGNMSAAVLSTAMIKPEAKREESLDAARRRVNQVYGPISGGLDKGQGGIRKFLHKFGETADRAKRFLGRKKREEEELLENNTDLSQGDSSFLLDSYNRMGEYSTLAKDRSLEGRFRAKG